jgi:hypothetical protein
MISDIMIVCSNDIRINPLQSIYCFIQPAISDLKISSAYIHIGNGKRKIKFQ